MPEFYLPWVASEFAVDELFYGERRIDDPYDHDINIEVPLMPADRDQMSKFFHDNVDWTVNNGTGTALALDTLDGTTGEYKKGVVFAPFTRSYDPTKPSVVLATITEHQVHSLSVNIDPIKGKLLVHIQEEWWDGSHAGYRTFTFREMVHFMMNVTDDELETIASR
jgi:hypothetical protein